jgi:hypothetical protein
MFPSVQIEGYESFYSWMFPSVQTEGYESFKKEAL